MKNIVLLICFNLCFCSFYGQKAMSFEEAETQGVTTKKLDSIYTNALDDGTGIYVFENEDEIMKAWTEMLQDISSFLRKKEEMRKIDIHVFQRVYFNKDGKIDYYLYKIRNSEQISEEQILQINEFLNDFVENYQFSLSADRNFVQCGMAKFTAK
jgi:hypothetical protein